MPKAADDPTATAPNPATSCAAKVPPAIWPPEESKPKPRPTRRGLLAGAAAFSAAGASAAGPALAVGAEADAELIRLCRQFHRQHAAAAAVPAGDDEALNAACDDRRNTSDLIEDMRPVTERGRGMKAGVAVVLLVENHDEEPDDADVRFALATLRDLMGEA